MSADKATAPKHSKQRKVLSRVATTATIAAMIFCLGWIFTGLFVYTARADAREKTLQKQYPVLSIHLSDYMKEAGLSYQATIPVTIDHPVAVTSFSGGGFTILGTGKTTIKSKAPSEYFPIKARVLGKIYFLLAPASSIVATDGQSSPVIHLGNPVINTYQPYVDCENGFIEISKITCNVDKSGRFVYTDISTGMRNGGMSWVLSHYGSNITAPVKSIP